MQRAGYSAAELYTLSRSANPRQRQLALRTLGRCCAAAREGRHLSGLEAPLIPALVDAGLPFLLRWGLDDASEAVSLAALSALAALVCPPLLRGNDESSLFGLGLAHDQWLGWQPGEAPLSVAKDESDLQVRLAGRALLGSWTGIAAPLSRCSR